MTTATTILALVPVLTSVGRGSDVMVPMAIPSVGGMTIAVLTMLVVPVLYCTIKEFRKHTGLRDVAIILTIVFTSLIGTTVLAVHEAWAGTIAVVTIVVGFFGLLAGATALAFLAMAVYCTICDLVDVTKRGSRRTVQPA